MSDTERRNLTELRRMLALHALPLVDALAGYADAPTRAKLATVRGEMTALWEETNNLLLAQEKQED